MSDTPPTGFDALQSLSSNPAAEAVAREPQIDAQGRAYATGKRKNAVARVWIKPGKGQITINGRDQEIYFARPVLRMMIAQPLEVTDRLGQFEQKIVSYSPTGDWPKDRENILRAFADALDAVAVRSTALTETRPPGNEGA